MKRAAQIFSWCAIDVPMGPRVRPHLRRGGGRERLRLRGRPRRLPRPHLPRRGRRRVLLAVGERGGEAAAAGGGDAPVTSHGRLSALSGWSGGRRRRSQVATCQVVGVFCGSLQRTNRIRNDQRIKKTPRPHALGPLGRRGAPRRHRAPRRRAQCGNGAPALRVAQSTDFPNEYG